MMTLPPISVNNFFVAKLVGDWQENSNFVVGPAQSGPVLATT